MIHLRDDVKPLFSAERTVEDFFRIAGESAKIKDNRHTLGFDRDGRRFFIKMHDPVGWREVIKNLLRFNAPVVNVMPEWRAIHRLGELSVPTMTAAAYGVEGLSPASQKSFLITDALTDVVSLEDIALRRNGPALTPELKRRLIRRVAQLARAMHHAGVNHRDLYLCHFLMKTATADKAQPELYIIDLHRAQCRTVTPQRWIIKDLAGLWFSAMGLNLTVRDRMRFVRYYADRSWRSNGTFWKHVDRRARSLYQKECGK